ncbi:MAG: hypothetical protein M1828_000975 [Chrysothrix sp. TS-e1954]|nr:MAG: hypothetical protein M1828_000975 [Chrysothrix sp. TS-e1954]
MAESEPLGTTDSRLKSQEPTHPTSTSPDTASPNEKDPITRSVESGKLPDPSSLSPADPGGLLPSAAPTSMPAPTSSSDSKLDTMDIDFTPPSDDIPNSIKELHPYSQILGINDIDSCVRLETTCFPPHQACSRDKFEYRLARCSELCLGMFSSATPESPQLVKDATTVETGKTVDSASPGRKGVLLAHLIATKTVNEMISDDDMLLPASEQSATEATRGHQEHGRTLAVHSLAVLPAFQQKGLGSTLMKAYVQRMVESDVADRISLLTYERLKPYYLKLGFEDRGRSDASYGGGEWWNMVLDFQRVRASLDE